MLIKTVSANDASILWKAGRIAYKLDSMQREIYEQYRAWEAAGLKERLAGVKQEGLYPRMFCLDMARRTGKDVLVLLIRMEDAQRRPGAMLSYGTETMVAIGDILVPLANMITADCPSSLRPTYRESYRGQAAGLYFPNGSVIKLVGLERGLDMLRGRGCDGCSMSEAAFVSKLEEATSSIIMPQFLGRPWATLLYNSTPNPAPGHKWDEYCEAAQSRGAYAKRTIMDSPRYSLAEKEAFIEDAGGRDSERAKTEYFVERIRSEVRTILPEFDEARHVKASPMPDYCCGYTIIDPGIRDRTGVIVAYYDFDRDKIVIRKDWCEAGKNTNVLVSNLKRLEDEVWHKPGEEKQYWNKDRFCPNPRYRFSDTELRLITDLASIHNIIVSPAQKQDAEAGLHALRNALHQDRLEIHPDCKDTILHFRTGIWNKNKTSYERNPLIGHADLIDCAKYLVRHVVKDQNPNPPSGIVLGKTVHKDDMHYRPDDMVTRRKMVDVVRKLFSRRRLGG